MGRFFSGPVFSARPCLLSAGRSGGIRRRSQEYFINIYQNLETLNHDLPVESWDLTIPWSGTCGGITSTTILAAIGAVSKLPLARPAPAASSRNNLFSSERSWFKVSRFCYTLMKYSCDRRLPRQPLALGPGSSRLRDHIPGRSRVDLPTLVTFNDI